MREQCKKTDAEGIPYVTINGEQIDARDRQALDEAFKQLARLRDQVVVSYSKHLTCGRGRTRRGG